MAALISADDFTHEVLTETRPVLLACLDASESGPQQIETVDGIAKRFGTQVKFCILDEEYSTFVSKRYSVHGRPSYLLFKDGEELGRLLGKIDKKTLGAFVACSLGPETGEAADDPEFFEFATQEK